MLIMLTRIVIMLTTCLFHDKLCPMQGKTSCKKKEQSFLQVTKAYFSFPPIIRFSVQTAHSSALPPYHINNCMFYKIFQFPRKPSELKMYKPVVGLIGQKSCYGYLIIHEKLCTPMQRKTGRKKKIIICVQVTKRILASNNFLQSSHFLYKRLLTDILFFCTSPSLPYHAQAQFAKADSMNTRHYFAFFPGFKKQEQHIL